MQSSPLLLTRVEVIRVEAVVAVVVVVVVVAEVVVVVVVKVVLVMITIGPLGLPMSFPKTPRNALPATMTMLSAGDALARVTCYVTALTLKKMMVKLKMAACM